MRTIVAVGLIVVLATAAPDARPDEGPAWAGEWITDLGVMTLTQDGEKLRGPYGGNGEVEGTVAGKKATLTWRREQGAGDATFDLADDGASFKGSWKGGGDGGTWRGWKKEPKAEAAKDADFSGHWLSSHGTLQLEQKEKAVKGTYGADLWGSLEGEVKGRRLTLRWNKFKESGTGWLEQTADGKRLFGVLEARSPMVWLGLRVPEFERHVKPKPGAIVQGRAANGMLYHLHTPKGWKKGKPTDCVVLLHGSNWTTAGMVAVTARQEKIGDRYFVLGIQGQDWASWSEPEDLRFNYTYISWVGRSTLGGFPGTERESPYLVAQVLDELKPEYGFGRLFVGGHSQGGFLTYVLHMHFPEKLAGTFPMSGGMIFQAEPDAFVDKALLAAQRAIPIAVVHGTKDEVVPYSTGQYCHERLLASGFPLMRHFAPALGHPYDFLPVADVIEWLDALSTKDAAALAVFARARADAGDWRDVAAAFERAKVLKAEAKLGDVVKRLDEAAAKEAPALLAKIQKNADNTWVDGYLAWQDQFEFAPAGRATVAAYQKLQEEHDAVAKKRVNEARACFRNGDKEGGREKWQEVVDMYYAGKLYRVVKRWLAENK